MAQRVSIKDVALRAGVSWKTVSNVVHERPVVKEATRRRVLEAIEELGYVPNLAARDLRGGPTRIISLVVPELQNPYFARLAERMQAAARDRERSVSVEVSLGSARVERAHVLGRVPRPADAVIISPAALLPADFAGRESGPRTVLLGERIPAAEDVVHVAIDNVASAADVVRHLADQGRRRLLFLGAETVPPSTGADRLIGYRAACRFAGIEIDPDLLRPVAHWNREAGRDAVRAALVQGVVFDAVIAVNDLLAIGALEALRAQGAAVPEQVAVVGWDDVPESAFAVPPLSSVAPDLDALVAAALDAATDPGPGTAAEVVVPHRLVVRESSGGARADG
ncbi:LacI family DNA-binding transcriptional regulator [Brachybacterium hainanense]|uniref:LacI family DNA-binding transcriptional regulator n=1 Tax=Brachybacterium hainanense TaxID=1541174 RepID=A0ABV6RG16_9MICO